MPSVLFAKGTKQIPIPTHIQELEGFTHAVQLKLVLHVKTLFPESLDFLLVLKA